MVLFLQLSIDMPTDLEPEGLLETNLLDSTEIFPEGFLTLMPAEYLPEISLPVILVMRHPELQNTG